MPLLVSFRQVKPASVKRKEIVSPELVPGNEVMDHRSVMRFAKGTFQRRDAFRVTGFRQRRCQYHLRPLQNAVVAKSVKTLIQKRLAGDRLQADGTSLPDLRPLACTPFPLCLQAHCRRTQTLQILESKKTQKPVTSLPLSTCYANKKKTIATQSGSRRSSIHELGQNSENFPTVSPTKKRGKRENFREENFDRLEK